MYEVRRPLVGALLALCASVSFASRSIAPPAIGDETAQTHQDGEHMAMALWFPAQSFRDPAKPDDHDALVLTKALRGYAIFGITSVTIDETAEMTALDPALLRSSVRLVLGDRPPVAAVKESDLPIMVRVAVSAMGPTVSRLMGKFGDSVQFVVFKDADEHGDSLADPAGRTDVTLTFDKEVFAWHLPLVSLQPKRVDAATGDTFPGDYDFSPFTGHKLVTAK